MKSERLVSMTTTDESTGIIEQPRDLDTLLKSTTYQGMTDEEIQRIIDFTADMNYKKGYAEARIENEEDRMKLIQEHYKEQAAKAEAAFNAAIMSTIKFEEV